MLTEEKIREFSDEELINNYKRWHEYFFEVVLIMNDEILKRNFEVNDEVQVYIKKEVKKIKKHYQSFTDKELREELKNIDSLGYAHQVFLDKEIKNRNLKLNSNVDKIINNRNSYFFKAYGLAGLVYALIWLSQIVFHLIFDRMGVMSEGYLVVERYIYKFLYTIPLIMIFQLEGNYREYHAKTRSYYNVGLNQMIYLAVYFSLLGLLYEVLSGLHIIIAIIGVIFATFRTSLVPFYLADEDMQLSYACQKSFYLTKGNFGKSFVMFVIFSLLMGVYNILPEMFISGSILINMLMRILCLLVASLVVKIYVKFYFKKF